MTVRLNVNVKPGSKAPGIERIGETYVLRVRERAVEGAANAACVRALADALHLRQAQVMLIRGERSRQKTFALDGITEDDLHRRLALEGNAKPSR